MSRLGWIKLAMVAVLVLLSSGGVHALSCELQQTSAVFKDRIEIEVSIDLQVPDDQPAKAVTVKEYIPKELYKNAGNGVFTGFGLMWNVKTIEEGKTIQYTLRVPEISEPAIYELKTVIEYQTYDDLVTLEKITRLVVYPEGIVEMENGEDVQVVKREGIGYNNVYFRIPDFKAYNTGSTSDAGKSKGKGKGNNGKSGDNGNDKGNNGNDGDNGKGNDDNGNNGKGKGRDK